MAVLPAAISINELLSLIEHAYLSILF